MPRDQWKKRHNNIDWRSYDKDQADWMKRQRASNKAKRRERWKLGNEAKKSESAQRRREVFLDIMSVGCEPDLPYPPDGMSLFVKANQIGCDTWELRSVPCEYDRKLEFMPITAGKPAYKVFAR